MDSASFIAPFGAGIHVGLEGLEEGCAILSGTAHVPIPSLLTRDALCEEWSCDGFVSRCEGLA